MIAFNLKFIQNNKLLINNKNTPFAKNQLILTRKKPSNLTAISNEANK